jgi:DNA-binding FadR family transcriptional regulator
MPKRQAEPHPPDKRAQFDSNLPLDVEIANRLIREIIGLKLAPGSWLREQEIAARFGVSRSPVREALRHIAKQGFVEMHPWRGAQLVELSGEPPPCTSLTCSRRFTESLQNTPRNRCRPSDCPSYMPI